MKKKIAAIFSACAALLSVAVGCNTKNEEVYAPYEIYTNIPAGGYKITSRNFKLSQFIDGFAEADAATPSAVDTSGYLTATSSYYGIMNSDAALYISANFTKETINKFNQLEEDVYDKLTQIDGSLSVTNKESYISKFNNAEAGETVEIDKTAYEVLTLSKEIYTLTEGYYNPAVYYSVQAYGFDGNYNYPKNKAQLPTDEEIENYKALSEDFGKIELSEDGESYYATKPSELKIDLGGIGKGYAVDEINKLIKQSGFEYGYFTFALSSIAFGKYFKGDNNYTLQLTDPRNRQFTYSDIPLQDTCVSTSGDYEQYYILDGVRYCHIINPKTGRPVQTGVISATVIGESAAWADALSTAIMAMGKDNAIKFIKDNLQAYKVIFTYDKAAEVKDVA